MEGKINLQKNVESSLWSLETFNPSGFSDERFPTPLDSLGSVDPKALIIQLRSLAHSEIEWDNEDKKSDCHHLYWPGYLYPNMLEAEVNPAEFRELPRNKVIIPVALHRFAHEATKMPEIPEENLMYDQIQAHRITQELFKNSWHAIRLERNRWISDERLKRGRELHLVESHQLLEKARRIPKPYQPIDFDLCELSTIEEVQALAHKLGKYTVAASNLVRFSRLSIS